MTDKKIEIDGVDVSGCVQFIQSEEYCCNLGGNCNGWTTCYYKQLKRAEQKLEKIKEIVNTHKQNKCITCSAFDGCLGHPYCDEVILQIIEE